MSFVSSLFSGANGAGFQPAAAPLNLTSQQQLASAGDQTGSALKQQQDFLNAVNAANGIGNQSQVFGQLQGVANGTGANPAQALLANATGQNVQQQAALMGSQRGASANPALIARQAAQAGAGIQQNAAGQGAALQAQQSLGALGQLGGLASTQANQQLQGTNALTQAAQTQQGQLLGAGAAQNQFATGNNQISGQIAQGNQKFQQGLVGGAIQGVASAPAALADGGMVSSPMADSPESIANDAAAGIGKSSQIAPITAPTVNGAKSKVGQALGQQTDPGYQAGQALGQGLQTGIKALAGAFAQGGKVPALVSPGEKVLNPAEAKAVADGKANPMHAGKMVPGNANVKGDSLKNDTVKAELTPGSVVVKRSVMNSGDDVAEKARAFVAAVMAHHGAGKPAAKKKSSEKLHTLD